jgi:hypothetical protein
MSQRVRTQRLRRESLQPAVPPLQGDPGAHQPRAMGRLRRRSTAARSPAPGCEQAVACEHLAGRSARRGSAKSIREPQLHATQPCSASGTRARCTASGGKLVSLPPGGQLLEVSTVHTTSKRARLRTPRAPVGRPAGQASGWRLPAARARPAAPQVTAVAQATGPCFWPAAVPAADGPSPSPPTGPLRAAVLRPSSPLHKLTQSCRQQKATQA